MPESIIEVVLKDFDLAMFVLAVLFIILHKLVVGGRISQYEIVYRWVAFFSIGLVGVYTFVMHAFYSDIASASIGWAASPFEYEVGVADLAIGVLGVCSFNASFGFRLATVTAASIWLLGDAFNHISQLILSGNVNPGNAGTWLWLQDLVVPLLLLMCINGLSKTCKE